MGNGFSDCLPDMSYDLPNITIRNYTVHEKVGSGTYGIVYRVECPNKCQYAIKKIKVLENDINGAQREAKMYRQLQHDNILKAHDYFFDKKKEHIAIVLQYCREGNLTKIIGQIEESSCKRIMRQIAEGLHYLHNQNYIHRDIKPENILLMNGIAKIGDLGLATVMRSSGLSKTVGTEPYAAFEVLHSQKYHFQADIWSLGMVFLEILIGKRYYELLKGNLAPALRKGFPSEDLLKMIKSQNMRQMVKCMLEHQPRQRLTIQQVLDMLSDMDDSTKWVPDHVIPSIHQNQIVKRVSIEQISQMSEEGFIGLINRGFESRQLRAIKLENCNITYKSLELLAKVPGRYSRLEIIDLDKNQITCQGLIAIAKLAAADRLCFLRSIHLRNNQIKDKGVEAFAQNVDKLSHLKVIDLIGNQITGKGLKALAVVAGKLGRLQVIGLSNNKITDEGLTALAENGDKLSSLQVLELCDNKITNQGIQALSENAGKLKCIQIIDLSGNVISNKGVNMLINAANKFSRLRVINIVNNSITEEGFKQLINLCAEGQLGWLQINGFQMINQIRKELAKQRNNQTED